MGGAYPDKPRLTVGAIVFHDNAVLLVKRLNPPNQGRWAIPGGRVKLGESLAAAAEREVLEETGITIQATTPVFVFDSIVREENIIIYHYVVIDLIAQYISGTPMAADDASDARWIHPTELNNLDVSTKTLELLHDKFSFGAYNSGDTVHN